MTNFFSIPGKYDCRIPGFVFLLTFVLYLPYVFTQEFILRDTALRYAPMAEAFSRGDWAYAFHPRVQCLHPVVSGFFVWIFNCSGFAGAQLSSLFFFALCAFPLYFLLKTVFDRNTACRGIWGLPLFSPLVLISVTGLREPHKMLVILLLAWGAAAVCSFRGSWRGYLVTGAGCGLAFITRNDLIPPALLVLFCTGVMEFAALKSIKRVSAAYLVMLPGAAAECAVNCFVSGYAVPGTMFFSFCQKIFGAFPSPVAFCFGIVLPGSILFFAGILIVGTLSRFRWFKVVGLIFLGGVGAGLIFRILQLIPAASSKDLMRFFHSLLRGVNFLLIPAGIGIFYQWKEKKWNAVQSLTAGIFLLFLLSPLFLIVFFEKKLYISSRYLLPAAPLLLGWAAAGIKILWEKLKNILPSLGTPGIKKSLATVLVGICLFHAYSRLWEEKLNKRDVQHLKTIRRMAEVFRTRYQGEKNAVPVFNIHFYQNNLRPRIYFDFSGKETIAAYLAGGSLCLHPAEADFAVSERPPHTGRWQKSGEKILSGKKVWHIWERRW